MYPHKVKSKICPICYKVLSSISKCNRHLREQHSEVPHEFLCQKCNKTFKRKQHLERHEKSCQKEGRIYCSICPKSFCEGYRLKEHLRRIHRSIKCSNCKSVFMRDQKHFCEGPRHFCEMCGKDYQRKGTLENHLLEMHNTCSFSIPPVFPSFSSPSPQSKQRIGGELPSIEPGLYKYLLGKRVFELPCISSPKPKKLEDAHCSDEHVTLTELWENSKPPTALSLLVSSIAPSSHQPVDRSLPIRPIGSLENSIFKEIIRGGNGKVDLIVVAGDGSDGIRNN